MGLAHVEIRGMNSETILLYGLLKKPFYTQSGYFLQMSLFTDPGTRNLG
jgi:hypothetical protein